MVSSSISGYDIFGLYSNSNSISSSSGEPEIYFFLTFCYVSSHLEPNRRMTRMSPTSIALLFMSRNPLHSPVCSFVRSFVRSLARGGVLKCEFRSLTGLKKHLDIQTYRQTHRLTDIPTYTDTHTNPQTNTNQAKLEAVPTIQTCAHTAKTRRIITENHQKILFRFKIQVI